MASLVSTEQNRNRERDDRGASQVQDNDPLKNATAPSASTSRDQIRSAIQDRAKLGAETQPTALSETSLQTSLQALTKHQEQFRERVIDRAQDLVGGAQSNLAASQEHLHNATLVDRLVGNRAALEAGVENDRRDLANKTAHLERLNSRYQTSLEARQAGEEMIATAKRVSEQGFTEEAAAMRSGAAKLLNQASESLKGAKALDPSRVAETLQGFKDLNERLERAINRTDTAITTVSIVKETAHVAGVGVGFALGGPAGGAAVNQGLRMIEGASEEGMNVILGNKTREEAGADFLKRSQDAVVESAITAASGAVGQRMGAIAAKMSGPVLAKTVDIVSSGTIQSAGTGVQIGYEFAKAHSEFEKSNPSLVGAEREKAYAEFMSSQGFSLEEVSKRLGASFVAGSAAKGVFHTIAQSGAFSQSVRSVVANGTENVASNVAEVTANGGPITLETVVPALVGGHVTHLGVQQGHATNVASAGHQTGGNREPLTSNKTHDVSVNGVQGTIRVSGEGNAEYVSSRELLQERYREQRSREIVTTDPSKSAIEADTIARQESKGVVAYYDKENSRVVVPEFKNMPEADRQKVVSFIHHEVLGHGRGGDEFAAYRVQADKANSLGLELRLEDGRVRLTRPDPGQPLRPTSDVEIREHIAQHYTKGQLESRVVAAGMEFGGGSELSRSNIEGIYESDRRRVRSRPAGPGPRAGMTSDYSEGVERKSNARPEMREEITKPLSPNETKSNKRPLMRRDEVTRMESDSGVESRAIRAGERGDPPASRQSAPPPDRTIAHTAKPSAVSTDPSAAAPVVAPVAENVRPLTYDNGWRSIEEPKKLGGEVSPEDVSKAAWALSRLEQQVASLREEAIPELASLKSRRERIESALQEKSAHSAAILKVFSLMPSSKHESFRNAVYSEIGNESRADALLRFAAKPETALGGGLLSMLGFGADSRREFSSACREAAAVLKNTSMSREDFNRQMSELKIELASVSSKHSELEGKLNQEEARLLRSQDEFRSKGRPSYFITLPGGSDGREFSVYHAFKPPRDAMSPADLTAKLREKLGVDAERVEVRVKTGVASNVTGIEVAVHGLRSEQGFEFARTVLNLVEDQGLAPVRRQVFPVFRENLEIPVEHFLSPQERLKLQESVRDRYSEGSQRDREQNEERLRKSSDVALIEEARKRNCLVDGLPSLPSVEKALKGLDWISEEQLKAQVPSDALFRGAVHPLPYWAGSNRAGRTGIVYAAPELRTAINYAALDGESPTRTFSNPLPRVGGSHVGFLHVFKDNKNMMYGDFGVEDDKPYVPGARRYNLETNITPNNELIGTFLVRQDPEYPRRVQVARIPDTAEWRSLLSAMMPRRAEGAERDLTTHLSRAPSAAIETPGARQTNNERALFRDSQTLDPHGLCLVHSTHFKPEITAEGCFISPQSNHVDNLRNSVHTTVNHKVVEHPQAAPGTWDNAPYTIIGNFADVVSANGAPYSLRTTDTFWTLSPNKKFMIPNACVVQPASAGELGEGVLYLHKGNRTLWKLDSFVRADLEELKRQLPHHRIFNKVTLGEGEANTPLRHLLKDPSDQTVEREIAGEVNKLAVKQTIRSLGYVPIDADQYGAQFVPPPPYREYGEVPERSPEGRANFQYNFDNGLGTLGRTLGAMQAAHCATPHFELQESVHSLVYTPSEKRSALLNDPDWTARFRRALFNEQDVATREVFGQVLEKVSPDVRAVVLNGPFRDAEQTTHLMVDGNRLTHLHGHRISHWEGHCAVHNGKPSGVVAFEGATKYTLIVDGQIVESLNGSRIEGIFETKAISTTHISVEVVLDGKFKVVSLPLDEGGR